MLKKILIAIALIVGGFLVFAATRPDTYKVERSTKIEAPPAVVFAQLEDFKRWGAWSPWEKLDPGMKKTYDGAPAGVGAAYAWQGNDKVGEGKMAITESQPPTHIGYRLEFLKPFSAVSTTTFDLTPAGEATAVTWSMAGDRNLMMKIVGIFMDMDSTIGGDFDSGLAALKSVSEQEETKLQEMKVVAAQAKAAADADLATKAKADAEAAAAAAEAAAPKDKRKR